ncbi:MAG TPA: TetR/AcrR family transcriptional regulator [Acidimicrobiales bacterium]|nr:TetR/AcrR family transcriptional regulator [Acidimicrobiales bacterium]
MQSSPWVHPAPGRSRAVAAPLRPVVRRLGMDDASSSRVRVVDAALRCVARCGLHKTTVDDVAREAGISRATLYRLFPGGKEAVVRAVVETETARLFSDLGAAMGEARDLETLLSSVIVAAARRLASHAALAYLFEHEPGTVLPHLAFGGMDRVLAAAGSFAAPFLGRWLDPEDAARAAEWATRIVVSYLACPRDGMDLTDAPAVRHLVATFVVPGIQALVMHHGGAHSENLEA